MVGYFFLGLSIAHRSHYDPKGIAEQISLLPRCFHLYWRILHLTELGSYHHRDDISEGELERDNSEYS